jgi:RNA polymerase sigma factor (TIGR02999 family)
MGVKISHHYASHDMAPEHADEKPGSGPLTDLLEGVRRGDRAALEQLAAVVYPELRRIAARYMRLERPGHTLQTTALVHEVYVRLFGSDPVWENRAHFFAAVSREMRHILVDYARSRNALKGPGGRVRVALSDVPEPGSTPDPDVLALDEALTRLERLEPRASRVVELRFFTGLGEREAAEALNISVATLKRDWTFAKAWLFNELDASRDSPRQR